MAVSTEVAITMISDAVAVLILLFLIIKTGCLGKKELINRFIGIILVSAIIDAVCNAVCYGLHDSTLPIARSLAWVSQTILELMLLNILFHWLLFVDYMLYSSNDHIKRNYGIHFIPVLICLVLLLVNPFTGILFTIGEDIRVNRNLLYNGVLIVEYAYIVTSIIIIIRYRAENGRLKYFNEMPALLPIFAAIVVSELTPCSFVALGFALGFLGTFIYMGRFMGYIDKDTGFFNASYIRYIKQLKEKGRRAKDMIICFEDKGDSGTLAGILKQELPKNAEVLHMEGQRFVMFAEGKNKQFADLCMSMMRDVTEEYNEEHPSEQIKLRMNIIGYEDL